MKLLIKLVCGLFILSGSVFLGNKVIATVNIPLRLTNDQEKAESQDKKVDIVSLRIKRFLDSVPFDMSKFYFSNLINFLRANGVMQRLDNGSEKLNLDLLKEKIKNKIVNVDILAVYLRYAEEEGHKAETASVIFPEVESKDPIKGKHASASGADIRVPPLKQKRREDSTASVIGECKLTDAKKGEASIKEFFSNFFKGKSLTNEVVLHGARIYLSELEFLFCRLVVGYDVEKIGRVYICKLNSSCNKEVEFKSFLLLESFAQLDNHQGFKIKSLYVIKKDDTVVMIDKRELLEQLIKELIDNLKSSTRSDEVMIWKISELSKQLQRLRCKSGSCTDSTVLAKISMEIPTESMLKQTERVVVCDDRIHEYSLELVVDRFIDRLYIDTEVPVRQMSISASIYVDKVYLFIRTAFYYEAEDKKSMYVCMLSSGEKLQIASLDDRYFLILEPHDMQKGLKGIRLSIKGMCRFNGTDIDVLSAKEIYTRLINEISKGQTPKQSKQPVVKRRLGTTIECLSKLKDVASATVQRYGDLLSNLRQIDCGVIVKRSYAIADVGSEKMIDEQLPLSMELGTKNVEVLSHSTKSISVPICTMSEQSDCQHSKNATEEKKSLFERLCDEAEERYQALNK